MDLYYDPIVDEHVSSPMGLIAPVWYLAPQQREIAESAWAMTEGCGYQAATWTLDGIFVVAY